MYLFRIFQLDQVMTINSPPYTSIGTSPGHNPLNKTRRLCVHFLHLFVFSHLGPILAHMGPYGPYTICYGCYIVLCIFTYGVYVVLGGSLHVY